MNTIVAKPVKVAIIGASETSGEGIFARTEEIGVERVEQTCAARQFRAVAQEKTGSRRAPGAPVFRRGRGRQRGFADIQQIDEGWTMTDNACCPFCSAPLGETYLYVRGIGATLYRSSNPDVRFFSRSNLEQIRLDKISLTGTGAQAVIRALSCESCGSVSFKAE